MEEKKKRSHKPETILKMKAKRRARTKQPRSGTSKKRQSLYQELLNDYKSNKEAMEWIKANKIYMDGGIEQSQEFGVITEYSQMYNTFYEFPIGQILFSPEELKESLLNEE